ncbi:TadE/TadG family type IV pilus assembly protein [Ralstonia flaminis]|jgi:Flp pilus assembly protein TadG|uniref:TadE-like domain-containing protein n=2 Tax=Ralstonia TaxID=48736 RepID=A0ABM9KDS8_9RALS|nr:TadE/TadG family type IV pilus assembly protein [Ralstonia sp. LMG 18101]CAJ0822722.1 hypothetical protein LMG18101_05150 [Ralstonia sp. LMG 18101]
MQLRTIGRSRGRGTATVEFALLSPFLMLLALGVAEFGWLTINAVMVVNAAASGARFFAGQRGSNTPYSDTSTQIKASAATLKAPNLSYSTYVGSTSCSTDSACALDLNSAVQGGSVTSATVTVTYGPYQPLLGGAFPGVSNLLPKSLSATSVERVQ